MKFKIGVFGSAVTEDVEVRENAWAIGCNIAAKEGILIIGGCGGLPHEAARGAADKGGLVIGISPAMNLKEHVEKYGFPADSFYDFIFTGMEKKGRNIISLRTCDAAIFIGGRTGTLNEFTIAYDEASKGFHIGILSGSGGVTNMLIDLVDLATRSGKGSQAVIIIEKNPRYLVEGIFHGLNKERKEVVSK